MSQILEIIDLEHLGLSEPSTIFELSDMIQAKSEENPGTNPKFVELAKRITALYPSPETVAAIDDSDAEGSIWLSDPVQQAQHAGAVWGLDLPPQGGSKLLHHLVKEGTELGLTMLLDSMGMAFLPDGRVLPEARQKDWDIFMEVAPEQKRPTMAQTTKKLRTLFEQRLAPYGFVPLPVVKKGFPIKYRRHVDGGWQQVTLMIERFYDKYYVRVLLAGQCAPVHGILAAALGPEVRLWETDYSFDLLTVSASDQPMLYVDTQGQIEEMFALLEHKALPVLDQVRTVPGLDRLYTEMPDNVDWSNARVEQFTALICARLMHNPRFAELEPRVRERAKRNDNDRDSTMRTEHLDRLLVYLRDHVKPLEG